MASAKTVLVSSALSLALGFGIGRALTAREGPEDAHARNESELGTGDEAPQAPYLRGASARDDGEAERAALKVEIGRLRAQLSGAGHVASGGTADEVAAALRELRVTGIGDSQLQIHKVVQRLVDTGPPAVPVLLEELRTAQDIVWSKGYSTSGGVFRAYPRLRTVLLDALRQIGSAEAQEGILDLAKHASLKDWQDLLIMYGPSLNPTMVSGISAAIPGLIRTIRDAGVTEVERQATFLTSQVLAWVRIHELVDVAGPLADLAEAEAIGGNALSLDAQNLFAALVDLAPQHAVEVARRLEAAGQRRALHVAYGVGLGYRGRLDRLLTFWRGVLDRTSPDAAGRRALFTVGGVIDDKEDLEAARGLLDLVERALSTETDPIARNAEERSRTVLQTQIEEAVKRTSRAASGALDGPAATR